MVVCPIEKYASGLKVKNMEKIGKGLVCKILGLSKIEMPQIDKKAEKYSLENIVQGICNEISICATEKKIPIIVDINDNVPSMLYGEVNVIKYSLKNLLINSINNMEMGYIKLLIGGHIFNDKISLEFKVIYTGKGIKEKANSIIDNVSLILEDMGSRLIVNNDNIQYKEFSFSLVQDIIKENKTIKHNENDTLEILVVDDNEININIFKNLVKNYNMNIHSGYSGEECLKLLEEMKYDIVFLDHMMFGLDGIETLKIHKKNEISINKDTPIIVLTANVDSGAREEYMREGFSGYLAKPIVADMLVRIIEENCL